MATISRARLRVADGTMVKVNSTFIRWTGYDRGALLGQRFPDVLTVGGQIFHETHVAPLLRMQGFIREIALEVRRADGTRLPVLVNAALRTAPAGTEIVRLTVFDATDRRSSERELLRARQRAEEAAAARPRLLSMISHDVRAPLTAILTAAMLLEKTEPTERQIRFIRVLRSSSEQALSLVNSILDLGRLEAGQTTLRERPFELQTVVRDVAAGAALLAERKPNLSMQVEVDERIPRPLIGDPDRLGQIVTNLLTNAVKFTERGLVSLAVVLRDSDPDAATVEVVVSDTGIGIPADRLDHIFKEYAHLAKPIEPERLVGTVARAAGAPRRGSAGRRAGGPTGTGLPRSVRFQ